MKLYMPLYKTYLLDDVISNIKYVIEMYSPCFFLIYFADIFVL